MKEIKFRAWIEKKMYHFEKLWLCGEYQSLCFAIKEKQKDDYCFDFDEDEDKEKMIFMQVTGLKDKNNKDIYEGDIIQCLYSCSPNDKHTNKEVMEVKWNKENCRFNWFLSYSEGKLSGAIKDIEIIGNIYENPELLEEGE